MRERAVPCRHATPDEVLAGRHFTFEDDALCQRHKVDQYEAKIVESANVVMLSDGSWHADHTEAGE